MRFGGHSFPLPIINIYGNYIIKVYEIQCLQGIFKEKEEKNITLPYFQKTQVRYFVKFVQFLTIFFHHFT
jgi:hypothetical protein